MRYKSESLKYLTDVYHKNKAIFNWVKLNQETSLSAWSGWPLSDNSTDNDRSFPALPAADLRQYALAIYTADHGHISSYQQDHIPSSAGLATITVLGLLCALLLIVLTY